jgi:hypothetical protein
MMKNTKTILLSGFTAGILDAVAAILLYAKPLNLHNISRIFRFIASGLFGKAAYTTGPLYPLAGLAIHFGIALTWSAIWLFILFRVFKKGSVWAKTILFASLIWIIMNGFVMPVFGVPSRYDGWAIMRSFSVILFCVSLPVCAIVEKRS